MPRRWPDRLWVVRHGESAGNVARDLANSSGLPRIEVEGRDVDVPLSPRGLEQARALGSWFATMPADERPTVILASPYARAAQTAELIANGGRVIVDERLREKEMGLLESLTRVGITAKYPEHAELYRRLGKFYYRPPSGESWCDVIGRLRSALDTISLHHGVAGENVLIVAHQVVVLCMRYLLENLTENQILEIDRQVAVANCGVTSYRISDDEASMTLESYNFVAPLLREGAPITAQPDRPEPVP